MVLRPWMYLLLAFGYAIFGLADWHFNHNIIPCLALGIIGAVACLAMSYGSVKYWAREKSK